MKVCPKVIFAAFLAIAGYVTTVETAEALPSMSDGGAFIANVEQAGWARRVSRCEGCPTGRCYGWPGYYPYYCEPVYQEPAPYFWWPDGRGGRRDYW
jgi:hypothetical protein